MALWNDLGRKVADTKDKTVQQAKVLSETQKLNAQIAEEKKKMAACYRELGMQYAALHHEDYEAAFAGVMGTILASEKVIQDSQEKIRQIKGIRCCEKCGAEQEKDAAFCCGCGAALPRPVAPAGRFCTGCGALLAEDMRFCTSCGTPVAAKEEPAFQVPSAEEFFAHPPVAEDIITEIPYGEKQYADNNFVENYFVQPPVMEAPRCPLCNAVMAEGMTFCTNCGCRMV